MKNINTICKAYTLHQISLAHANNLLAAIGAPIRLDPAKNSLTPGEIQLTSVGAYAYQANGWGLLFSGTGNPDKIRVERGVVQGFDSGCMPAEVIICGRVYKVKGSVLSDY